jgi:hypothetical protein
MTIALANTIIKDTGFEGPMLERNTASGTSMRPGTFVRITNANEFNVQNVQGADVPTLLLIEDKCQGDHTTGGGVQAVYAAGSPARAEFPPAGALRYARIPSGQTLALGDSLIFNNAGFLIRTTGTPAKVVAWAEEVVTNNAAEELVLVRIA